MSVKEYAVQRGKSAQSVYKQMKSKENGERLDGHIHVFKVNNKDVKYLDEEAVKVLDEASQHSVQVILQTDDKERIAQLEEDKQALLIQIAEIQNELIQTQKALSAEKDNVKQLQAEKIELLEMKLDPKPWWKFWG